LSRRCLLVYSASYYDAALFLWYDARRLPRSAERRASSATATPPCLPAAARSQQCRISALCQTLLFEQRQRRQTRAFPRTPNISPRRLRLSPLSAPSLMSPIRKRCVPSRRGGTLTARPSASISSLLRHATAGAARHTRFCAFTAFQRILSRCSCAILRHTLTLLSSTQRRRAVA